MHARRGAQMYALDHACRLASAMVIFLIGHARHQRNLDPRRAQVFLGASRMPSPAPNSVEHVSVYRVYEARIQWVPRRRANAHSVASRMLASSYSRARCRPRKQIDLPDLEVIGFEPATPTSRLPAEATTHPVPMRNSPSASLSVTLPPVIVCPLFTDESPHPVPPGPSVRCLIRASVLVTETVC